ncbi:MAG: hypothetical protein EZS28_012858 [Streblomastix strix]|uniref:Uncharacterized protein n=1 Tax=Streblomastix strix TaxID=222440 RepID=A0A5J4WAD7_9EUKA|nr:MAG: hypothetical protein EZS28_012858 [Streblomastix strix]
MQNLAEDEERWGNEEIRRIGGEDEQLFNLSPTFPGEGRITGQQYQQRINQHQQLAVHSNTSSTLNTKSSRKADLDRLAQLAKPKERKDSPPNRKKKQMNQYDENQNHQENALSQLTIAQLKDLKLSNLTTEDIAYILKSIEQ